MGVAVLSRVKRLAVCASVLATLLLPWPANPAAELGDYRLHLASGDRVPDVRERDAFFTGSKLAGSAVRGAVIQFDALPSAATRDALARFGVELYTYIPDHAFLATVPASVSWDDLRAVGVRWVGTLRPEEKIPLALGGASSAPDWCRDPSGLPRFTVKLYPHVTLNEAAQWLVSEYGARILATAPLTHAVEIGLPAENWSDIAGDERVLWIEPFWPRVVHNNSNRTNVRADVAQAAPYSLTGAGVMVGQWDEGRADPSHADFGGRVLSGDASTISTHATHVAGTVLGSGVSQGGTYKGMAPSAAILTHQWWSSASELETEYQNAIENADMDITQNSWGVGYSPPTQANCKAFLGNYFTECGTLDNAIRGALGKPVTVSWSAGNERGTSSQYCGSLGFTWGTVTPYGTAKNVITVGAINSNNSTMTSFSSWGPTDDGRVKPELVAPGCQTNGDYGVTSTKPGSGYTVMCGTSMSAPTVTGCVALWLQRYKALHPGAYPLASTVKSVFVESADDLGDTGPEYDWGYGRINVTKAVDLLNAGALLEDQVQAGQTRSWTFVNDGSLSQISFTLAWDDPAAAENASVTLINDLDIQLKPPSGSPVAYYPWVLDPANPAAAATHGADHRNNLEQVRLNAPLETGTWTVEVHGNSVPQGPQQFSLAYSASITLAGASAFAVTLTAAADTISIAGLVPLHFQLANSGTQNDTYDVTLTSARGWTITPNPLAVSLPTSGDSNLTFALTVPSSAPFGSVDTVVGVAVSQGNGSVSDRDTIRVTVISGRAVSVGAGRDTVGVPGRAIALSAALANTGQVADSIDWSVTDQEGWTLIPQAGTVPLAAGRDTLLPLAATISPAAGVGAVNRIILNGVSQGDPAAHDADTMQIAVIDFPPLPSLVSPAAGSLGNNSTPTLVWTHVPYTEPPLGFGVFSHIVEVGDDSAFTVGTRRYGPIPETTLTVPDSLPDGLHFWRILTQNVVGDSSGFSLARQFEIDTKAPELPLLISPQDGAADADSTPLFTWSAVAGVKSARSGDILYRWQASTDWLFTTSVDSVWTAATAHQVDAAHAFGTCSTTVFWRVTAMDAAGNLSAPSTVFSYVLYRPGDVLFDCEFDIRDVVALVEYVLRGGSPPVPLGRAETNCEPPADIRDVVSLVDHVFRGGPRPCGPP
jgi:hypothetical protein